MARKAPAKKQERLCSLCYGVLSDQEQHIHDRHRDTEIGKKFLASLERPKLKVKTAAEIAKANGKKGGRPRGTRSQFWLSQTEQQVVDLMIVGHTTPEIAELLGRSKASVSTALERGKAKTGSKTLYELVAKAVKRRYESDGGYRGDRNGEGDHQDRPIEASESSQGA